MADAFFFLPLEGVEPICLQLFRHAPRQLETRREAHQCGLRQQCVLCVQQSQQLSAPRGVHVPPQFLLGVFDQRAAELGWIKGFEDGTFRPDTYITRAQAMTMINRVLNRIPEDESDLLPGMNVWPDCNPGDWFYLAVQEATNSHDFKHKAGNYETWTGMNKDPDWTRYEH